MDVCRGVLLGVMLCVSGYSGAAPLLLKSASVDTADLAYVEAGAGDPIVFVHGELQDYRAWNKHVEFFERDYRAIAYSRRNHFPNVAAIEGVGDGAADAHGDDLAAFIKSLGLQRAHVVAHSSGAHAALFFASRNPDMVRTLVLHEPPAIGMLKDSPVGIAMYQSLDAKLAPARDAFRGGQALAGVRLFNDTVIRPGSYEDLSEELQKAMLDNAAAQTADALAKNPPALFSCDMAARITAPTLITTGTRSLPLFQRIVDKLKECLPNDEHVAIAAAHDLPTDDPRAFNKAVRTFLKERGR